MTWGEAQLRFKRGSVLRNSLAVQWLRLHVFAAEGPGSIPGWGTKIPQAHGEARKKSEWGSVLRIRLETVLTDG